MASEVQDYNGEFRKDYLEKREPSPAKRNLFSDITERFVVTIPEVVPPITRKEVKELAKRTRRLDESFSFSDPFQHLGSTTFIGVVDLDTALPTNKMASNGPFEENLGLFGKPEQITIPAGRSAIFVAESLYARAEQGRITDELNSLASSRFPQILR